MPSSLGLFLFALIFTSVCFANKWYHVQMVGQDGECTTVPVGECINCTANGELFHYFVYYDDNNVFANQYSDSCYSGWISTIAIPQGNCNQTSSPCSFSYIDSVNAYSFEVESNSPLSVSFLTTPIGVNIFLELSLYQAIVRYNPSYVTFESGSAQLKVIRVLSSSEYLTNLGVMKIGVQYNIEEFKFNMTKTTYLSPSKFQDIGFDMTETTYLSPDANFPFFPLTIVVVSPVTNISVNPVQSSSETYVVAFSRSNSLPRIFLFLHDVNNVNAFTIGNPSFTITDLNIFPPYEDSDGLLAFQLEPGDSYHAIPCIAEFSGPATLYDCEFQSLDPSFSWEMQDLEKSPTYNTDNMAFELF